MTEPLNLCRQFKKHMNDLVPALSAVRKELTTDDLEALGFYAHCLQQTDKSVKFLLPVNGRLFEDRRFSGIVDENGLRLPFPFVAFEYLRSGGRESHNKPFTATKCIVLARQMEKHDKTPRIGLIPINFIVETRCWSVMPEITIDSLENPSGGERRVLVALSRKAMDLVGGDAFAGRLDDYSDEVSAVLCFISAMSCVNVATETVGNRTKTNRCCANAMPFDEYKVLVLKGRDASSKETRAPGGHASPREHLRRGHIRRLDGGNVWVNSCIVNPGVGGRIVKDYAVRAAA